MIEQQRHQRRRAEGAHPCRLRVVADHSRQVPSRACRSARRKSPSSCRETSKETPPASTTALRPILFLVPRGAPPTAFEARKREAENLRARFQSCDEGLRLAMALPDVAVRETISRQSVRSRPAAARRAQQHAGRPADAARDVRSQGVETFAVCQQDAGGRRRDRRASARLRDDDVSGALSGASRRST